LRKGRGLSKGAGRKSGVGTIERTFMWFLLSVELRRIEKEERDVLEGKAGMGDSLMFALSL
jgi:hypothetical protein